VDHHYQGNNLHGIYSSFKNVVPKAAFEPYVFWRVAPATLRLGENAGHGALNEATFGFRLDGALPAHFDYDVEMVGQTGSLGVYQIGSWAGHWLAGKSFPTAALSPRVYLEANVASGTKDPASHSWQTFDQLYPSSHDKLGFADQIGWKNIRQIRAGFEQGLRKKFKLRETVESFWLASAKDALYASNGSSFAQSISGAAGRHVGEELDIIGTYEVAKAVSAGFGYSHIFTGQFLNSTTPGKDYNYPYVFANYHF